MVKTFLSKCKAALGQLGGEEERREEEKRRKAKGMEGKRDYGEKWEKGEGGEKARERWRGEEKH